MLAKPSLTAEGQLNSMNRFTSKKQLNFLFICSLFLWLNGFLNSSARAESAASPTCFNFNQVVTNPLRAKPYFKSLSKDLTESGKMPTSDGGIWGLAVGKADFSVQSLYQKLLDHYSIKNPDKVKLKIYPQERQGYQDFHLVMVTVNTPIIKVNWEEEWAYAITEGTSTQPKKVVISYQKTNGSHFVPHLCGSIVLSSLGPNTTEVYLYEEVNALGKRSPEETVKGHLGTLDTLRRQITVSK
jgi:hypothetical protein